MESKEKKKKKSLTREKMASKESEVGPTKNDSLKLERKEWEKI